MPVLCREGEGCYDDNAEGKGDETEWWYTDWEASAEVDGRKLEVGGAE